MTTHATLGLDAQTQRDLEILPTAEDTPSLFALCDRCATQGGSAVLKRRMHAPLADPARIRETQASIAFILEQADAFGALADLAYTATRVEHYEREILPLVRQTDPLGFVIGALSLWINHDRHYVNIIRGVRFTSALINALRRFIGQEALEGASGEVAPLLDEMRELLSHEKLDRVPAGSIGRFPYRILRLDQVFRLTEKETLARLLTLLHEVDALVAMAITTREEGYVLPEVDTGPVAVEAEELVHPFVAGAIANPVDMDQHRRVLFLTGPNMAGKTTYLRSFSVAFYLAHLGMGVPAKRFRFVPVDHFFSSISMSDDLHGGISYFRAEALRVKAVAEALAAGRRVVAVMDEPFKGTNVKDAYDASLAILERYTRRRDCLFMFSSHLIELSDQLREREHIDLRYFQAAEDDGPLKFDYRLQTGISDQRLGMRVLEEEGIFELLDRDA